MNISLLTSAYDILKSEDSKSTQKVDDSGKLYNVISYDNEGTDSFVPSARINSSAQEKVKEFLKQYSGLGNITDEQVAKAMFVLQNLSDEEIEQLISGQLPTSLEIVLNEVSNEIVNNANNNTLQTSATFDASAQTNMRNVQLELNYSEVKIEGTNGTTAAYTPGSIEELFTNESIEAIQAETSAAVENPNAEQMVQILNQITVNTQKINRAQSAITLTLKLKI